MRQKIPILLVAFLLIALGVWFFSAPEPDRAVESQPASNSPSSPANAPATPTIAATDSASSVPAKNPEPPAVLSGPSIADVLEGVDLTIPAERERVAAEIRKIEARRREAGQARARELGMPLRIERPDGSVQEVAGIDEFGKVVYFITHNTNAAISTGANLLNASPYNLNGSGIVVGVWDGGVGRASHQEFGGRLVVMDGGALNDHATHVAGTVIASGVQANAKGMAPAGNVDSYDWNSDKTEMTSRGAAAPNEAGMIFLSNHSYGYGSGWNYVNGGTPYRLWEWLGNGTNATATEQNFGRYNTFARDTDSIAAAAPYYLIFRSAGNDRNNNPTNGNSVALSSASSTVVSYDSAIHPAGDGTYRSGFENIGYDALAKNIVTVGAATDAVSSGTRSPSSAFPTSFSSFGPTDDGRIKPDLVANGDGLYSTLSASNTSYGSMGGTSMSSPNATGTAALLVQEYRRLFPGSAMRSSTLKGLLLHTADDRGNAGPDYKHGWGLINAKAAVDLIREHQAAPAKKRITENTVTSSNQVITHDIIWDGSSPIRVTLCWTDPAGTSTSTPDLRTARLRNNLDVKITAPDSSEHFPFVMPFVGNWTVASMDLPATRGVNNTDNVEQVYIPTPPVAGQYRITVSYSGTLANNQQVYSLLVSGSSDQSPSGVLPTVWHNPALNEVLINQTMRSPAYEVTPGGAFTVYSGVRKFNNPDYGVANQTGGTLYYRAGTAGNWTATSLNWHADNGDYQFWKADIPGTATSGVVQYYIRLAFDSGVASPVYLHGNDGGGFVTANQTVAQASPYSLRNRIAWLWHEPGIAGHQTINSTTATLNSYIGYIAKDGASYQAATNGTVYYTTDGSTPVGGLGVASDNATRTIPFSYIAKQSNASATGDQMHWRAVLSNLPGGVAVKYRVGFWNSATNEEKFQPATTDASFDFNIASTDTSATVTLGNLTQTYDSTARSVSVTTNTAGLTVAVTYNGSATAPTAAGNYSVSATVTESGYTGSAAGTLSVARKGLTISGLAATNKFYDGTTSATVTGNASLVGVVAGDSGLVVLGGTPVFSFSNANIGLSKPVTASGYTISGNKSANYLLTQPTGLAASITIAPGSTLTEISGSTQSQAESPTTTSNGTSHSWNPASDVAGFNGAGFLQATPDNGTKLSSVTGSPMVSYTVNVTHPGTYYIWLRGYAATSDKARAFVGLNDGTPALIGLSDLNAWKWTNSNRAAGSTTPIAVTVPSAGNQTLKIWMADAGFRLDQLLLTVNPAFTPETSTDFWRNQNIYQILTDRFFDGNPANNNVYGWAEPDIGNKTHGGDFEGVIAKLDYVKALGATALWISPVVKNGAGDYDYHGYDGTDFYNTDPRFGSLADLRRLVFEANKRGILVVNDVVVNHASTWVDSAEVGWPTFRAPPSGYTLRYNSGGNKYAAPFNDASLQAAFGNTNLANIFHNHGSIQDWNNATQAEYGEFSGLDDFRTSSQYVRDRMAEIYSWWIQQAGFDAFRVDTVKHVEMDFWNDWNPRIRSAASAAGKPNFFQFGEVYDGSDSKVGSYTGTKTTANFKFDSILDFPLYYQAKSVFANADAATSQLEGRFGNLDAGFYDPAATSSLVTFLDNHDLQRFQNVSGNNTARLDVALAFLYTARGIPSLYYGTEQDFNGGNDPTNREDMFAGSYESGPSLGDNFNMASPRFKRVALLNNFRRLYPALRTGTHHNLWADFSGPGLLAYARRLGGEEVFEVLNTASTSQTIGARPTIHPAGTVLVNLLNTAETVTVVPGSDGIPSMAIPPMSVKMFVAQSQMKPLAPVVESFAPLHDAASVSATGNITITFSKAMNRAGTQSAFSISPSATGSFSWNSGNTVMTFSPSSPLTGNSTHLVRIDSTATDSGSVAFHAPFESRFRTGSGFQPSTVTLGNLTQTYNRTARSASATTNPPGLSVSITYNGSATAPTNAGNYTVNATITQSGYSGSATNSLAITRKGLTISGLTGVNKPFDGTTTASVTGNATLVGVVVGDTVVLGGTPAFAFSNATVGNNKTIAASGYTISGSSASNYLLAQPTGLTANITAAAAPVFTGASVNGTFGAPLSHTLAVSGNATAFTIRDGALPAGLNLNTATGVVSGTPSAAGSFSSNITASNTGGQSTAAFVFVIAKADQAILGMAATAEAGFGATYLPGATATSNLTVSYVSSNTSIATVSGNAVTAKALGTVTITARQLGNANWKRAADVRQTLAFLKADQTINFKALTPTVYGSMNLTISAGATSRLPVSFSSSNPSVAAVTGNMVTVLAAGNTTLTASQAGNSFYNAAAPVGQMLTVNQANQTIAFPAVGTLSLGQGTVLLNATASTGLLVEYTSSNTTVATVSGNLVTLLAPGRTTLTASQSGNANYLPATNASRALTVASAMPTLTTGNASAIGSTTVTLNGEIVSTGGINPVERGFFRSTTSGFADGTGIKTAATGNFSSGAFSLNATGLVPGTTYSFKAFARNTVGTSYGAEQSFTTARIPQTISFTSLVPRTFGAAPFALSAIASSNLTVSFTSSNPSVATVEGNLVTILGAGNSTITATQAGNQTVAAASPVEQVLSVGRRSQTISFGPLSARTIADAPFALSASATSNLTVTFTSSNPAVASVSGNVVTLLSVGTTTITASQSGASNDLPAESVSHSLVVGRSVPIVHTGAASGIGITTASLVGEILSTRGANAVERGFFFSTTEGFGEGMGTKIAATGNFTEGAFTLNATGLRSNTPYFFKAFARNSGGTAYGAQQSFTTLKSRPAIAAFSLNGTVGTVFSQTVNATNSPDLFVVTAGALPVGLTLNSTTGVIAGTPSAAGTGNFTVTAANNGGNGTRTATFTIAKGAQTITGFAGTSRLEVGETLPAGASVNSGLPITYASSNASIVSIANGTLSALIPGVAVITASQPGNANWNAAALLRKVVSVGSPLAGVNVTPPSNLEYDGTRKTHTATTSGVTAWTYHYTGRDGTVYYGTSAPLYVGDYAMTAVSSTTTKPGYATANFTISPKPVTLSLTGLDKSYDGTTSASAVATVNGRVGTDNVVAGGTPVLAFQNASIGANKPVNVSGYALTGTRAANYLLIEPSGIVANITTRPLTITANDVTKNFGDALTSGPGSTAFTSSGLLAGESIASVTITYGEGASAPSANGLYIGQVVPSAAVLSPGNAANYDIQYVSGNILVSLPPPEFFRPVNEGNGTVTVLWNPLPGAVGYEVQSSINLSMAGAATSNATETEATFQLADNTVNYFRVRSIHESFTGPWSDRQVVQLVRINPGVTHYAGLAAHPGNFTVSGIFGANNEAGLTPAATSTNATQIRFLNPTGAWASIIFRSSTANAWIQGTSTPAGELAIPPGTAFTLRNPSTSLKQYVVLSGPAFANPGNFTRTPSGPGKWSLFAPLRSRPSLLSDLGFHPGAGVGDFLAGSSQSTSDYIIVNDGRTVQKSYWFNILEGRWYSGTTLQSVVPTIPAGVGFYIRQAPGSTWSLWSVPQD